VQVDPGSPRVDRACFQLLKLNHDGLLSSFAFNFKLRRYTVVLAALISPVPLLTVTYAMEYDCDIGLGASAVNAGNFVSFALLLAVANADFSNPARAYTRPFLSST
jgi:hypothetical protein